MNIYVKNNLNGIIHRVGDDRHDSLIIEDGKLSYYNLQCGEGTRFGGYSFCDKNGNTDFENDCYDNYYPIDLDSIEKELLNKIQKLEEENFGLLIKNSSLDIINTITKDNLEKHLKEKVEYMGKYIKERSKLLKLESHYELLENITIPKLKKFVKSLGKDIKEGLSNDYVHGENIIFDTLESEFGKQFLIELLETLK